MKKYLPYLLFCAFSINFIQVIAQKENYITYDTIIVGNDTMVGISYPGYPLKDFNPPKATISTSAVILNVPIYLWSFGCSPTSGAMIAGYWDRNGYPNMYKNNLSIAPLSQDGWSTPTNLVPNYTYHYCPLSASFAGYDGRPMSNKGHVNDYYYQFNSINDSAPTFWAERNLDVTDPAGDCVADGMRTSRWNNSLGHNKDGSSTYWYWTNGVKYTSSDITNFGHQADDIGFGQSLFYIKRGYGVIEMFNQQIYGYLGNTTGFTLNDYKAEINAGRPVFIHLIGTTDGHTMVGVGYEDPICGTSDTIYVHDTWNNGVYAMQWAGAYGGMLHHAVSIIHLQPLGGGGIKNWDGGAGTLSWFDGSNWDPDGVPNPNSNITINATKAPMVIISGSTAVCASLTIASGAGITIVPSGSLTTNGLFTNNGLLLITSDATGASGSFINNGGLAGSGTFEFDRYLVYANNGVRYGWHLISSPVNNTVSGDFVSYWLKKWDNNPSSGTPSYFDIDPWGDGNTIPCETTDYSFGNIPLEVMHGYSVKEDIDYPLVPGATSLCPVVIPEPAYSGIPVPPWPGFVALPDHYIYFGKDYLGTYPGYGDFVSSATEPAKMPNINTGDYNLNVNWLNSNPNGKWNMIGNPYPSSIACAAFRACLPSGVNGGVYFWDNANLTYQVWAGGVGSAFIPPTQAFMVEVKTQGYSGTISIKNGMRTHHGANIFYKSTINNLLILQAIGNGLADKTYIRFLEEAYEGFDSDFDAHKLLSDAEIVPQIYTTIDEEKLAINTLPETKAVPMSFEAKSNGIFTIEAIETSEFENVVLEDVKTGEEIDLLTSVYTFNYDQAGEVHPFIIHFTPLTTFDYEADNLNIWSKDQSIYVRTQDVSGEIAVFNVLGQLIIKTDLQQGLNILTVDAVNTYYIVRVLTNRNTMTEKVFIR